MTEPINTAKKFAISNAVIRKLKLPKVLLNSQLFANSVYGTYSGYRYSNYFYHRYINKKIAKDAKPLNFKPYEFKKSQFLGFDFEPTIALSIIIPAYNVENFIVPCLDSILSALNGYENYEIIVVEDCSTDRTRKILLELADNYKNLKLLLNEKNLGLSASRNKGLKNSQGFYVTFVDSDDLLSFGILSESINFAINKNVDIIEFNFFQFAKDSDIGEYLYSGYIKNAQKQNLEITSDIFKYAKGFAWGKIYKRELFEQVRFPEGIYWEDAIISNVIFRLAKNYLYFDRVGYLYRSNPNSISNSLVKRNLGYDQLYVIKYCYEMAKQNHLKMDNEFYKRLFLEASVFLNNRTGYLNDSDLDYMFTQLELIFGNNQFKSLLSAQEKRIFDAMSKRNVAAWRAIAF